MSLQQELFGFSAKQIKALWILATFSIITSIYWIISDFRADSADSEGLTITVGGADQSYHPLFSIDLNHSPADSLELIPGIGPAFSQRIVAYRDSVGRFEFIEDVTKVKGISHRLLQKIRPYLKVTP